MVLLHTNRNLVNASKTITVRRLFSVKDFIEFSNPIGVMVMDACPLCGSVKGKNLYDHLFYVHSYTKQQIEDIKEERRRERLTMCSTVSNCKTCQGQFPSKRALIRHVREAHPERCHESEAQIRCPICHEGVKSHHALVDHAQANHSETPAQYRIEVVNFPNREEFEKWKRISEEHDLTSRAIVSSKQHKSARVTYMRCHRAAHGGIGRRKLQEGAKKRSRKAVPFCTAFMKVTERDSGVTVEYCSAHCGHDIQPELLRLDKQSEQYIVSLLRKGLKFRKVYEIVKEKAASQTLFHYVTLRKIWNIAKKYSLRPVDIRRGKGVIVSDSGSEDEESGRSDAMEVEPEAVDADPESAEPEPITRDSDQPEPEPVFEPSALLEPEPMVSHPGEPAPEPMDVPLEQPEPEPEPSALPPTLPEPENIIAYPEQPEPIATPPEQPKPEPSPTEPETVTEKLLSEFTVTSERLQPEILVQTPQPEPDFLHAESLLSQEQNPLHPDHANCPLTRRVITPGLEVKVVEVKQEADDEKPPINYEMANMEVLGRIEKIIAGFHADVLQIATQANRSSYSTLNKALRAMEAARAQTQSAASKILKESGSKD
ncbi:hypothetical protein Y032_0006g3019 [Ancylostoma ceylanicum]|uniref:C2H2-type domain-containing protein n=1 Tax=Ancylostoma ceylanicum TaxID=53326 RepID=A0A016VR86_9BILA|nr:hypothetical protein Y032_0006g3019 [Ancylostoma ceylanicum]